MRTQLPVMIEKKEDILFGKQNYRWMLIGAAIIALGLFVMSGGKSQDPNIFDTKQVYSTTRITLAPILIIAGLLVEVYAIMRRPTQASKDNTPKN